MNTHVAVWRQVEKVEEDRTPPVHPVDAIPDADAFASLFITFIVKQQPCHE